MIKIMKNIFIYLSILFFICKYSYAIDEGLAIKYIENVGQQAINILKTPIENLEQRELLFKNMLNNNIKLKFFMAT